MVAAATSATIDSSDPLLMSAMSPAGTSIGAGDELVLSGTSTLTGMGRATGNTVLLVSTGPACGLGGITSIPMSGYAESVTLQQGYGYVAQLDDATYLRFYVTSLSASGGAPSVQIDYEYPTTLCPTGHTVTYGISSTVGCALSIDGVSETDEYAGAIAGRCAFPVVGCAESTTIRVWGAGGSGGDICTALSGGAGGGGGGGGGSGEQTVALTPGTFYVALVGVGGTPTGDGFSSCPAPAFAGGPGGDSSFFPEDGGVLLSAAGGQGGTGGGAAGGTGGAGGGSTATMSAVGGTGSNGVSNAGNTLCGGAGSCGPGGAGGSGAGPDGGAGGAGGCTPGSAGAIGGGGAGGSQGGPPTYGAAGQITIAW